MIDIRVKYQANIFIKADDITPTPSTVGTLINLFSDRNLIPTTYQGFSISGGNRISRLLVRLTDPNSEWSVTFGTDRVDIDKNPLDVTGSNLGDFPSFCATASNLFSRILTTFNKRANRLAFNSTVLFGEMPTPTLNALYRKFFNTPRFYEEHEPFEWEWRSASSIPTTIVDINDYLNVITEVSRISGELLRQTTPIPFDRIRLFFDINTTTQNQEYRFGLPEVQYFFGHTSEIHNNISRELQEYIDA